jgi:hypothetical protein
MDERNVPVKRGIAQPPDGLDDAAGVPKASARQHRFCFDIVTIWTCLDGFAHQVKIFGSPNMA